MAENVKQTMLSDRIVGAALLVLLVLCFVTAAISGSDTSADGFDSELVRLAESGDRSELANAAVRTVAGIGIVAIAALMYVALRERSQILSAISAFVLCAGGVLALIANALQLVYVDLAEQYTSASGGREEQLLVTGRTVALATENVTGMAMISLMAAIVALAVLFAHARIGPRWLAAIPATGTAMLFGTLVWTATGHDADASWLLFMAGVLSIALWLLVTGCRLLFAAPGGVGVSDADLQRDAAFCAAPR